MSLAEFLTQTAVRRSAKISVSQATRPEHGPVALDMESRSLMPLSTSRLIYPAIVPLQRQITPFFRSG
ncbi:protein of unknown function [Methylocaldum szegediense]|uniref:Uncharacterized protein n=1 Tax=Methylocaldum szegediense TaxID=73780 RepID=A0ABN8X3P5_9GAMM|nr:protein of unknown function [Methylocaldum szegediense]